MAAAAKPNDDPADLEALRRHAAELEDAVDSTVAAWAERCVVQRWSQWQAATAGPEVEDAARAAGRRVHDEVLPALHDLLATDVDQQRTNPLSLLRRAVVHPTEALRSLGVPPVDRDVQAQEMFPDDAYDLTPGAFADVDPSLHEPGLVWGAAKAHVVLARRRRG